MAASPTLGLSVGVNPSTCPFCGQPLLKEEAVEHLASQIAAYEADLRKKADAEAQFRADTRVEAAEKTMKAHALAELKLACLLYTSRCV